MLEQVQQACAPVVISSTANGVSKSRTAVCPRMGNSFCQEQESEVSREVEEQACCGVLSPDPRHAVGTLGLAWLLMLPVCPRTVVKSSDVQYANNTISSVPGALCALKIIRNKPSTPATAVL